MERRLKWGLLIGVPGAIFLAMVMLFVSFLGKITRNEPTITPHADAVVVLTGGSERIGDALSLMEAGAGKRLFVSGVHQSVSGERLRRLWPGHDALFTCCIDLDYRARNTRENIAETRDWVRKQGFRSVLLVTASYHMPRAALEFSNVLPEVALFQYPVIPDASRLKIWWRDPVLARILVTEFAKWLLATARLTVTGLFSR